MQNSRLRQQSLEAAGGKLDADQLVTSELWRSLRGLRPTRRTTAFAPLFLDIAALPLAMAHLLLRRQPRPGATVSSQSESPRVGNAGHVVQWWQYTLSSFDRARDGHSASDAVEPNPTLPGPSKESDCRVAEW
jgi:hypothetical protein